MKLDKYKPSKRIDDRRPQQGRTTIGQVAHNAGNAVLNSINNFGSGLRMGLGYKEDPEKVRKRISKSIPDIPLGQPRAKKVDKEK